MAVRGHPLIGEADLVGEFGRVARRGGQAGEQRQGCGEYHLKSRLRVYYSMRSKSTGFVRDALNAWEEIVSRVIPMTKRLPTRKYAMPSSTL